MLLNLFMRRPFALENKKMYKLLTRTLAHHAASATRKQTNNLFLMELKEFELYGSGRVSVPDTEKFKRFKV